MRVALRRAAHQLLDDPRVFDDPMALRIIGPDEAATLRADAHAHDATPFDRALRAFLAARSRIAEDALAQAVDAGVRQYVVLGAGLDTFAYRNPYPGLVVFEVDFPATQEWKQACLEAARIAVPASLRFVPVDFERQSLSAELATAGLDAARPVWFSWLGVTPYLERAAVMATLRDLQRLAGPNGGVAFDYGLDRSAMTILQRAVFAGLEARVRRVGEPFRSAFVPAALVADLRAIGFNEVEDLDPEAINARYFAGRGDGLRVGTIGHMVVARVTS
jgi:methyltransferase (TIGR00027 family)